MAAHLIEVGQSGLDLLTLSSSHLDPNATSASSTIPTYANKIHGVEAGNETARVHHVGRGAATTWLLLIAVRADDRVIKIAVLSSGCYLTAGRGFPDRLEFALKAKGQSVTVVSASVGTDTAARGLVRLNRSVPEDTDAMVLELDAIDRLYGTEPNATRTSLAAILQNLGARRAFDDAFVDDAQLKEPGAFKPNAG